MEHQIFSGDSPEPTNDRLARLEYFMKQIDRWANNGLICPDNQPFALEQIRRCVEQSKLTTEQDGFHFGRST